MVKYICKYERSGYYDYVVKRGNTFKWAFTFFRDFEGYEIFIRKNFIVWMEYRDDTSACRAAKLCNKLNNEVSNESIW
jgi:hypothetical protein